MAHRVKSAYERDMEDSLYQIAHALDCDVASPNVEVLIAAAKEARCAQEKLERVAIVIQSMADRAEDNPQGIKAETLSMFADELRALLVQGEAA